MRQQEQTIQEIQDRLSEVAYLTEIPISKRSDEQNDRLIEIYEENNEKFNVRFDAVSFVAMQMMKDWEDPLMRWESVYQDSNCKPPLISNTTHTLPELESLSNRLAAAIITTGGVLEEVISVQKDFEESMEYVYATFRVLSGFSKASKSDDLVLAKVPIELLVKQRQVDKYHAIFLQREKTLKTTKEMVSQLISTNEYSPRAVRVTEPKQPSSPSTGISSGTSSRRKSQ